jgi:K+-sensing histidine kinase KdpD
MELRFWQLAFAALVAVLLYWKQLASWANTELREKRVFPLGYIFAGANLACVGGIVDIASASHLGRPMPRFDDLFLLGIALTVYLFGAAPAAALLACAIPFSFWILPPAGSLAVGDPADVYRVCSFAAVAVSLIWGIGRLKVEAHRRRASNRAFAFATIYAVLATLTVLVAFNSKPIPRFNDIFLVGIAVVAYLFNEISAAYLLGIALVVTAWVLPPANSLAIARLEDDYRILSFCAVAGILIAIMKRLKKYAPERENAYSGD